MEAAKSNNELQLLAKEDEQAKAEDGAPPSSILQVTKAPDGKKEEPWKAPDVAEEDDHVKRQREFWMKDKLKIEAKRRRTDMQTGSDAGGRAGVKMERPRKNPPVLLKDAAEEGEGKRYWGKQQTLTLIAAVEKFEFGLWADIKSAYKEEFEDKSSDNLRERWKNLTAYDKRRGEGEKNRRKNSQSFYPDDEDMDRIRKCNAQKKSKDRDK